MLGLKLNHVIKRGYWRHADDQLQITDIGDGYRTVDKNKRVFWLHESRLLLA